ncbi:MAG: reactive intermediate/imine deaminase [Planctomycetes bacterium]|nr:reactive intermediate/imine deaminase [Planctomycetota bacterium]
MESNVDAVSTSAAPEAIGPYSQATVTGGWVFCSGQVGLDPSTGELVAGGVEEQTRRVFLNLLAVMEAAGGSLADVARCTVYLNSMDDFAKVNEIYASYFTEPYPARATVEVSRLPKDALVEIDAVAKVGHSRHGLG